MIKAIVFDLGGVIVPGNVSKWVNTLPKSHPTHLVFQEKSRQWNLGELSVEGFYGALSEITGRDAEVLKVTLYDDLQMYFDVVDIVRKLKKNYKIVLFTNNFAYNVEKYFEKLPLKDLFDEVVISSNHKMAKPDPLFYKKMLEIIKLKPEDVVFIDNTQINVDTGNSFGIKSLLFTDANILKQDLISLGIVLT